MANETSTFSFAELDTVVQDQVILDWITASEMSDSEEALVDREYVRACLLSDPKRYTADGQEVSTMDELEQLEAAVWSCITEDIVRDYESARAKAVALQLQLAILQQLVQLNKTLSGASSVEDDEFGVEPT